MAWQDRISKVTKDLSSYRICCSINLLLLLLLLDVIRVQPRLALIVETYAAAANDIFRFVLVFLNIVFCFASSSTLLFGHDVTGFSSFSVSFMTCFELLVSDMTSWLELKSLDPQTVALGFAWVSGYICLVSLVILNMLLAIVMDTYSTRHEVIAKDGSTRWSKEMYLSFTDVIAKMRRRPTIDDVVRVLEMSSQGADIVTPELLLAAAAAAAAGGGGGGAGEARQARHRASSFSKDLAEECIRRAWEYKRSRSVGGPD